MINTKAIRIRMLEKDVDTKMLADAIKKKPTTVRQKISGYRPLSLEEARIFQEVLDIPDELIGYYFFNRKSHSVTQL